MVCPAVWFATSSRSGASSPRIDTEWDFEVDIVAPENKVSTPATTILGLMLVAVPSVVEQQLQDLGLTHI